MTFWYPAGIRDAVGAGSWTTGTMRVLLLNASGAWDETHNFISSVTANELSGTGYARQTLANKTLTTDTANNYVVFDADDLTYTAINAGTIGSVVIYREVTNDADSIPWIFLDPTNLVTNGGNVTLQFNVNGIARIAY